MKSIINLFFGFLPIISVTFFVTGSVIDIKIIPETTYMLALEGAELKLDCIVEFKETTNVKVNFYIDDVIIPVVGTHYGFNVIVSQTFIASLDLYRTTTTLIKNVTNASDRGSYKCRAKIATEDRTYNKWIKVITFTASEVDRELQEDDCGTVEFPCTINIKAAQVVVEHTIFWERNGTRLADDDKYKITNTTLQISKPTRKDLGAYQCVVVIFPTSMMEKQTVRIKPVFLKASPKIESHDSDKYMVLGDNLELKCKISGYPTPTVSWFKDEKEIKTTSRIHILEYEGAMGKLVIHSLEDKNEGNYKCLAKNEVEPFNADAKMTVRVEVPCDGDECKECLGIGAILGSVIAALAVEIVIGVICTWFILNRQEKIKGSVNQINPQPTMSQDTEFTGATSTLNTYEQLQNRTDSENREAYDSLDGPEKHPEPTGFQETEFTGATSTLNTYEQLQNRTDSDNTEAYYSLDTNSSSVPPSQSQYECLGQGEETSHTYTDLNQSR